VSGNTAAIGARWEDSGTSGVNSTPDESATDKGAVYVFERSGFTWSQQAYLKSAVLPSLQAPNFGTDVDISGDTVVAGAPFEGDNELASGAAYVFTRSGGVWTQQARLQPEMLGVPVAYIGESVAVRGDVLVIGSGGWFGGEPGSGGVYFTASYIYTRSVTTWARQGGPLTGEVVAFADGTAVLGDWTGEKTDVHVVPLIGIEQPAGTGLTNGTAAIAYGTIFSGSPGVVRTITVRNRGLNSMAVNVGVLGNADDFALDTTGLPAILPGLGSGTITLTFTPVVAGNRTATLRVLSSDVADAIFDIALTATTLSFTADSDGDGLNDASEFQLAALGFNWQVNQAALVTTLFSNLAGAQPNLNAAGFFTTTQVQALHIDVPLISRAAGSGLFKLTLGLQKSTGLTSFTPFPFTAGGVTVNGQGKVEFEFASPDDAAFFRLETP